MVEKFSSLCESCLEDNPSTNSSASVRCLCGCLLARLVAGGVELKCRRCKRICFIPFENPEDIDLYAPSSSAGRG